MTQSCSSPNAVEADEDLVESIEGGRTEGGEKESIVSCRIPEGNCLPGRHRSQWLKRPDLSGTPWRRIRLGGRLVLISPRREVIAHHAINLLDLGIWQHREAVLSVATHAFEIGQ